ncbi:MAG: DDE-type integrase/transposase/recombinase [Gemmatimonadota bacterium]|nr:DDE-type integrase/transposase/recombinase [Gemmatimonadota bacterium]
MKRNTNPFKWRHFEPEIILLCVRWYCRYQLSYRDLAEMMRERGLSVHHSTLFRWVQAFAPEINKRIRPYLKMSGTSDRVDETYISAKCDISSAERFFKKMMRADHRRLPFSISVDKNAAYPDAFGASQEEQVLPKDCCLRRVKYLNNVIEQDHRFIKKKVDFCRYVDKPTVLVLDNAPTHRSALFIAQLEQWMKKDLYVFFAALLAAPEQGGDLLAQGEV